LARLSKSIIMNDKELLKQKLNTPFQLNIGDVISNSFEIFGKAIGSYVLLMLLGLAAIFIIGIVAVISWQLAILVGVVAIFVGVPALQVGLARFTKKLMANENPTFSEFFSGFQYNLGQLVLQAVVVFVITTTVTIAIDYGYYYDYYQTILMSVGDIGGMVQNLTDFSERHSNFSWLRTFGSIFSFYIGLGLSLTPYIVSFYKVNAFTAMDISFRAVNKVVFKVAALHIVLSLIGAFGFVLLFIGGLASMPILFIGSYLIFKYTIGERDSETDDEWAVNEHLV